MQDTSLIKPDLPYHTFLDATNTRFQSVVGPLFVAEVPDLWPIYLNNIPAESRQHWNCNTCKDFIRRYGAIVTINEDGTLSSPIWNVFAQVDVPEELAGSIRAIHEVVCSAKVAGVFASAVPGLGHHTSGGFRHLAVALPSALVFKSSVKLPHEHVAEKAEEFAMLSRGLEEFKYGTFADAVRVLKADAVDRAEKFAAHAEWLLGLKHAICEKGDRRSVHNRRWLAVAKAPQGWAHVRSSMIGTLLEDIESGLSFDAVKARWAEKMHPLRYQRPQAAPAAGAIAQAEKLVEQLGLTAAFKRRFCRLDEVEALWRPTPKAEAPAAGGVFANVKAKGESQREPLAIKAAPMTFRTFREKHLGSLREIELLVPPIKSDFVAFTTAVDPAAPLLFKWTNPVSWYRYHFGSSPHDFNLATGWVKVLAICEMPAAWGGAATTYRDAVFMLEGCRDTRDGTLGLFPECIRGELHGVRSVIEAFSKTGKLEACEGQVAAGLSVHEPIHIRAAGTEYTIRGLE